MKRRVIVPEKTTRTWSHAEWRVDLVRKNHDLESPPGYIVNIWCGYLRRATVKAELSEVAAEQTFELAKREVAIMIAEQALGLAS